MTWLLLCGVVAQLVEPASHRYRGGHAGSNPIEASTDFLRILFSNCSIGRLDRVIAFFSPQCKKSFIYSVNMM